MNKDNSVDTIFEDLFIFEMANNHQGSVEHGEAIIAEMAKVAKKHGIKGCVKLQYRNLDTFVHPEYRERKDVPHIPRFLSTELSGAASKRLVDATKRSGLLSMVTPFDEASVQLCLEHGVDLLKVASCSARDWPLLAKVADAGLPIVVSTGGLGILDIDNVVSFFSHKKSDFALMHCVALYPTPNGKLDMSFLSRMKDRYRGLTVGYSGHEAPDNLDPVRVAVSLGAKMLERHVGLSTDEISLNAYSMDPGQVDSWIGAALCTRSILGDSSGRSARKEEESSLLSLQRGVFAGRDIKKGEIISGDSVFFAMPCGADQLDSGSFGAYRSSYVASRDYKKGSAVFESKQLDPVAGTRSLIREAKGLLYEAKVPLGKDFSVELSHHYGIDKLSRYGAIIVNVINREYCKKIVVVLPGQSHPNHRHVKKEETFQLLGGELTLVLNGIEKKLLPGDQVLIERGAWHAFSSEKGAVFEEVSTTHYRDDSYYEDSRISELDPLQRKTTLDDW